MADPESSVLDRNSPKPPPGGMPRLLAIVAIAGFVAGTASLLGGEAILKHYQGDLNPRLKIRPSAAELAQFKDAQVNSATLTFMTMGGVFGLAMGLAGGLAGRSARASVRAAIVGFLLGTVAEAVVAWVLVSIFYKNHDPQSTDLVMPLLTHSAILGTVGASGGLAFGLGLGGRGRWQATLVGGLLGAIATTIFYELVGALAFASSKTDQPLSASLTTRAMAQLLVTVVSAVGAIVALRQMRPSAAPAQE